MSFECHSTTCSTLTSICARRTDVEAAGTDAAVARAIGSQHGKVYTAQRSRNYRGKSRQMTHCYGTTSSIAPREREVVQYRRSEHEAPQLRYAGRLIHHYKFRANGRPLCAGGRVGSRRVANNSRGSAFSPPNLPYRIFDSHRTNNDNDDEDDDNETTLRVRIPLSVGRPEGGHIAGGGGLRPRQAHQLR